MHIYLVIHHITNHKRDPTGEEGWKYDGIHPVNRAFVQTLEATLYPFLDRHVQTLDNNRTTRADWD